MTERAREEEGRRQIEPREGAQLLKLWVDEDLYRAFQRCVWIIINETGRSQSAIMNEVVRDFLVKNGC